MKKKRLSWPILLGIVLILLALGFAVVFQIVLHLGAQENQAVVSKLRTLLPEQTQPSQGILRDVPMPVLEIDGTDYCGILEIPGFGIALAIADKWDSSILYQGPRRFYGSAYNGTLVIGGGDYGEQFSFCDKIDMGAVVSLTDMTGTAFSYTVVCVDRSDSAPAEWLTDGDHDLTLFCRDLYSMEYLAVRCVFSHRDA